MFDQTSVQGLLTQGCIFGLTSLLLIFQRQPFTRGIATISMLHLTKGRLFILTMETLYIRLLSAPVAEHAIAQ